MKPNSSTDSDELLQKKKKCKLLQMILPAVFNSEAGLASFSIMHDYNLSENENYCVWYVVIQRCLIICVH